MHREGVKGLGLKDSSDNNFLCDVSYQLLSDNNSLCAVSYQLLWLEV